MKKVLYILGSLDEEDVVWFASVGQVHTIEVGGRLVDAGAPLTHFKILLEGKFGVYLEDGPAVAGLGAGDVVGEMSLVEKKPPSTSVVAEQPGRYLSIPLVLLQDRLQTDIAFAARLYKALALFLSDRLRETTHRLDVNIRNGSVADSPDDEQDFSESDEIDEAVLDNVHLAGSRMRRLVQLIETGVS